MDYVWARNVRLWDLRAGSAKAIINAFETQATSVAYGRDYCVLANSRDNAIKVRVTGW